MSRYLGYISDFVSTDTLLYCFRLIFENRNTKDLTVLKCNEKQMLKLAELIKTALNDVGCEELPSGCDDISVDPSFIESNIGSNDNQQPVSTYCSGHICMVN